MPAKRLEAPFYRRSEGLLSAGEGQGDGPGVPARPGLSRRSFWQDRQRAV